MKTRVGQRYRDYVPEAFNDDDFTHCERCGIELLKTETRDVYEDDGLTLDKIICPLCADELY